MGRTYLVLLRGETKLSKNFIWKNCAAVAGVGVTVLGDSLSAGVKVEDELISNKRLRVAMTSAAMTCHGGDVAYGGRLAAKFYPQLGDRSLWTHLGISFMDWHGDLDANCHVQCLITVGRHANLIASANLNNRSGGKLGLRLTSHQQHLQLSALAVLIIILRKVFNF